MKNKKVLMIIASIILVLIIILGSSYAYLRVNKNGSNQNISIANFGLVIKEDMKAITLDKELPKTDEEGLKNKVNTFTIENQGDVTAKYKVSLIDSTIQSTMSNLDIRYQLTRTRSTTGKEEVLEIKNLDGNGLMDEGTIVPNEEISYKLIIWIDYDANPNGLIYNKVLSLEGLQADTLDTSGANPPEMLSNMIPVYYDKQSDTEGVWKVADITNQDEAHKWYDYNDFMWANAVTVKESNGTLNEDGSMTFDGVDDYYDLGNPDYDFKNKISIITRIKLNGLPSREASYIIGCTENNAGFYFQINNGKRVQFGFFTATGYQQINSGVSLDLDKWYTIIVSYDASHIRLYIFKDADLVGKNEIETNENIKVSKAPLMIGANPDNYYATGVPGSTRYLNATIKSVYIYTDALTEDEVTKYFSGEITDYPKDNLLVEKTEFNELDTRQKYLEAKVGTEVKMDDISSMWVWIPRYKYTIFNGNNETSNEQIVNIQFEHGIETTGTVSCHDVISTDANSISSEVCTDETNGSIKNGVSTYTHPAFTFGDDELVGFWYSKFEISTDDSACLNSQSTNCNKKGMNIYIKPNQVSLRYQDHSTLFANFRNMEVYNNVHGFSQSEKATSYLDMNGNLSGEIPNDSNNYDIHMEKNMEWGAIVYLTMSKYGKYGNSLYSGEYKEPYKNNYNENVNNVRTYKTGYSGKIPDPVIDTSGVLYNNLTIETAGQGYIGAGASTTGTVYGIYDVAGGYQEYVMANSVLATGKLNVSNAGTWNDTNVPLDKYYDHYSTIANTDIYTKKGISKGKLGDATKEITKEYSSAGAWYNDHSGLSQEWFTRGGYACANNHHGMFLYAASGGGNGVLPNMSSRPVLTISREIPWKK